MFLGKQSAGFLMRVICENSKRSLLPSRLPRRMPLFLRSVFWTNPPDPKLMNRSDHGWKLDLNMYECNLVWVKTQPNLCSQICLASQNIKLSIFLKPSVPLKQGCQIPVPQGLEPTGFCDLPGRRLGENCFLPDRTENWVGLPPLRTGSRRPCPDRTVPDLFRHRTSLQRGASAQCEVCFECRRAPADVSGHVRRRRRLRLLFLWAACC